MALVELRGASKAYGSVQAIEDVDLDLEAGEVRCLAGENGAGKSTIIKVLTGAIRRDEGGYEIDGEDMGHPGPAEARAAGIGVVYQEPSLLPELTVQDNLLMGRLPSRLGAHAADVLAAEPATASPLLWAPNVTITPHVSAQTTQAIDRIGAESAAEVLRVLRGEPARNPVTA
jgi:rhamnose transport system ATP-binding protein